MLLLVQLRKRNAVRSSHQRCSIKEGILRSQTCNFYKKRLWHRCFLVNFAKFSRAPFSQNTSGRLLLFRVIQVMTNCTILLFYINFSGINFLTFLTLLVASTLNFISSVTFSSVTLGVRAGRWIIDAGL